MLGKITYHHLLQQKIEKEIKSKHKQTSEFEP